MQFDGGGDLGQPPINVPWCCCNCNTWLWHSAAVFSFPSAINLSVIDGVTTKTCINFSQLRALLIWAFICYSLTVESCLLIFFWVLMTTPLNKINAEFVNSCFLLFGTVFWPTKKFANKLHKQRLVRNNEFRTKKALYGGGIAPAFSLYKLD